MTDSRGDCRELYGYWELYGYCSTPEIALCARSVPPSSHAAHVAMLANVRAIREASSPGAAERFAEVAAGVRNLAQPVLLEGEESDVHELVDVAQRLVELADALEGKPKGDRR